MTQERGTNSPSRCLWLAVALLLLPPKRLLELRVGRPWTIEGVAYWSNSCTKYLPTYRICICISFPCRAGNNGTFLLQALSPSPGRNVNSLIVVLADNTRSSYSGCLLPRLCLLLWDWKLSVVCMDDRPGWPVSASHADPIFQHARSLDQPIRSSQNVTH